MSYLDPPRLHFAGTFFTNPSTINNATENYSPNIVYNDNPPSDTNPNSVWWNPNGQAFFKIPGAAPGSDGRGAGVLNALYACSPKRLSVKLVVDGYRGTPQDPSFRLGRLGGIRISPASGLQTFALGRPAAFMKEGLTAQQAGFQPRAVPAGTHIALSERVDGLYVDSDCVALRLEKGAPSWDAGSAAGWAQGQGAWQTEITSDAQVSFVATRWGEPVQGMEMALVISPNVYQFRDPQGMPRCINNQPLSAITVDGTSPDYAKGGCPTDSGTWSKPLTTGADGSVTVNFAAGDLGPDDKPEWRKHLDGQMYLFAVSVPEPGTTPPNTDATGGGNPNLAILLFENLPAPSANPTWWEDVHPILEQYARLYPLMRGLVDLSSYSTLSNDQPPLQFAQKMQGVLSLPMSHPGFMPVTRDLSLRNRKIILDSLIAIEVGPAAAAVKASQSIAPFVQQTDVFVDCPTEGTNSYSICFRALSGECNKGEGWAACQEQAAATCRKVQHGVELRCGQAFRQGGAGEQPTPNLNLAVTGGGLLKLGDTFFLVFGQQFEGMYSVDESDYGKWPTLQRYTEQVVALAIEPKPLAAAILYYLQQDPADPARQFHRRDLNVLPALNPATGTPRIAVHGGVFVPGEFNGFQSPILLDAIDEPAPAAITSVQTGFAQKTSLYESATASVVIGLDQMGSAMGQTRMMQILIGGIGVYDIQDGKLQAEEGLPFTHNLTVVSQDVTWQGGAPADTRWTEYVRAAQLDSYMGTDAHFVPDPALSMSTKGGVISLDGVDKPVLLGHVFGGILADAPQSGGNSPTTNKTSASNALYEVWLTPGTAPAGYWVDAADAAAATGLDKSFGSVKKRAAGGP